MQSLIMVAAAFLLGCIAAVPAGPVQIEVVRRAVNGHIRPALMVVLGAFSVDMFYGVIALFGIAPVLREERVIAAFWLAGGIILGVLSIMIIRQSGKSVSEYQPRLLHKKRWALLGGISLSGTNPVMILWWLSAVRLFREVGIVGELTPLAALSFLTAGSLGLAAYLSSLALFLYWAKRFISPAKLRRMNLVFGLFLLSISSYFIYTSLRHFLATAL